MIGKLVKLIIPLLVISFFIGVHLRQPEVSRVWEEELAVWPEVEFEDQQFKIVNLRDWDWEAEGVVEKRYIERTYSFDDLEKVWFIVEPFGAWDGVAHTFFSFEFKNSPALGFSVEARKEIGEKYSAFRGLFNEYELAYLWATEEDLLTRRAVYLGNELYMYELNISEDGARQYLRTLLQRTQELGGNPEFYNTWTSNCTNILANHANTVRPDTIPWWHPSRVITGYADETLFRLKLIENPNRLPWSDVKEAARVDEEVKQLDGEDEFSKKLRMVEG